MAIPCASLPFPSSSLLLKASSFSSQFPPLLSPSHLFLTVCSRHTPAKSTNARNSYYTNNTGIAYLKYPVVVKAQTSSSSALSREPMLPPFNVLITGSTKGSFFSWFSNYCLISLWCLLCCVYCCGFWFGFAG
jgi:chlorophyll(ide) b reductase